MLIRHSLGRACGLVERIVQHGYITAHVHHFVSSSSFCSVSLKENEHTERNNHRWYCGRGMRCAALESSGRTRRRCRKSVHRHRSLSGTTTSSRMPSLRFSRQTQLTPTALSTASRRCRRFSASQVRVVHSRRNDGHLINHNDKRVQLTQCRVNTVVVLQVEVKHCPQIRLQSHFILSFKQWKKKGAFVTKQET